MAEFVCRSQVGRHADCPDKNVGEERMVIYTAIDHPNDRRIISNIV
jgi:hypothetical protein